VGYDRDVLCGDGVGMVVKCMVMGQVWEKCMGMRWR